MVRVRSCLKAEEWTEPSLGPRSWGKCVCFVLTRIIISEHGHIQSEELMLRWQSLVAGGQGQSWPSLPCGAEAGLRDRFSSWPEASLTLQFSLFWSHLE